MNVIPFGSNMSMFLFFKLLLSLQNQKHTPDTTTRILKEYDYIVVGAGPGGSTVSSRLSEEPCVNILLLEAGKSPPITTEIPIIARSFVQTDIDWGYYTAPQRYTGNGLINRQVSMPSGKAVGGSSVFNGMMYVRGARKIYDRWAEGGATGWSYDDVLPYFKKMEMNRNYESVDIPYHGFKGPLTIQKPIFADPYRLAIYAAMYELGHEIVDVNGLYAKGFYDIQATMRNGQRCSVPKAYLVPVEKRKNLDIVKNAFVTKILIENRRAVGVQFDYGGDTYIIRAKREVIVSAGAKSTPKLLMLSGIGPKEHLEEMNIPVIADLPVGFNLQDHPTSILPYYSEQTPTVTELARIPENIEIYIANRTGPLAAPETIRGIFFGTNNPNTPPDSVPDYEIFFLDGSALNAKTQYNLKPEVYESFFGPYELTSQFWCFSQNIHSKSHGIVRLRSANPYDDPLIDPNYLSEPQDLIDIVEGMKECERVFNTRPVRSLGIKPFQTLAPGCETFAGNQGAYFSCIIKLFVISLGHQVGTAKMGDPYDPTTVVDPELRVKTVKGLRVVDASVMPLITAGNTIAPTIMIAEKAADMIRKDIYGGCTTDNFLQW